jgi:hypothetical protein
MERVSFTPLLLYSQGNRPRYTLYRRLSGPQSRSGHHGREKNLLPLPGIESRYLSHPSHILAIISIRVKYIYMWKMQKMKKSHQMFPQIPGAGIA